MGGPRPLARAGVGLELRGARPAVGSGSVPLRGALGPVIVASSVVVDFFLAPLSFDLTRRALFELTVLGVACGAVGVLVVLRGLAFMGDALAHCVVPGV